MGDISPFPGIWLSCLCGGKETDWNLWYLSTLMHLSRKTWKLFGALLLVGLVASLMMMLALAEIHEHLGGPRMERWDAHIQDHVHGDTTPRMTRIMFALTYIGSPRVLTPAIAVIAVLLWWRRLRHAAMVWLIATGGAGVLVTVLKLHFHRIRPDLPWAFVHEPSFTFPSGHSVFAVVVYGMAIYICMRRLRRDWQRAVLLVAAGALIFGIGVSRIYLGAHYPSDVAAGYFVGAVWLTVVVGSDRYVRRVEAAGRLLKLRMTGGAPN
jgi:membrane-associated phospholipid phosphatase